MKILIAEDDQFIREGLRDLLESEGYSCILAENGRKALECWHSLTVDLVLLDIMMPIIDGYSVCREIRQKNQDIPVIFISAKAEEIDQVLGLELGADDYIMKPFGTREVVARIRAVTRRSLKRNVVEAEKEKTFLIGDLIVYPDELRAQRKQNSIDLSLRDVKILQLFSINKNKIITRDEIFNFCWGRDYLPSSRTLDQHISKLRKTIELNPKEPKIIVTIHGAGFRYQ